MNLPNSLTLTRICLAPLLVVVLLTNFEGRTILGVPHEIVGALIFAVASITDWLDGKLARWLDQYSKLGEALDPLADRAYTLAALVAFVIRDIVGGGPDGGKS